MTISSSPRMRCLVPELCLCEPQCDAVVAGDQDKMTWAGSQLLAALTLRLFTSALCLCARCALFCLQMRHRWSERTHLSCQLPLGSMVLRRCSCDLALHSEIFSACNRDHDQVPAQEDKTTTVTFNQSICHAEAGMSMLSISLATDVLLTKLVANPSENEIACALSCFAPLPPVQSITITELTEMQWRMP